MLQQYACDLCRARKLSCGRTTPQCQRCCDDGLDCQYSRYGTIRRQRRRRVAETSSSSTTPSAATNTIPRGSPAVAGYQDCEAEEARSSTSAPGLTPMLAADIDGAREHLENTRSTAPGPFAALSLLSETSAAVWLHQPGDHDKENAFFVFPDKASSWADVFVATLQRGEPMMISPPPNVVSQLRASLPDKVSDSGWLVTYYSIILAFVSSEEPASDVKRKLQHNLWKALNDVRILLEPSETNIQALTLLAAHVEEFTTPTLSWMLVSSACRQLQALGINLRRHNPAIRERRQLCFWHLSMMDMGMANIFGRPPVFDRVTVRETPIPTLAQVAEFQPHVQQSKAPGSFAPHLMHRWLIMVPIMADTWSCLHEDRSSVSLDSVIDELEKWERESVRILDAAAMIEKPFLDNAAKRSIDLGMRCLDFQYTWYHVLLSRASPARASECIHFAKRHLWGLEHLVSDSEEPFNGIIWQLICTPFTSFLILFGKVLSNSEGVGPEDEEMLAAMEQLPTFLTKMARANTLAAKLEPIAVTVMEHLRSLISSSSFKPKENPTLLGAVGLERSTDWNLFLSHAMTDDPAVNLEEWTSDFLSGDSMLDWISWDMADAGTFCANR